MSKLFRTLLIALICLMAVPAIQAQDKSEARKQWFTEMRQLRTNYVAKELNLTAEQREKFVPLYDAMLRDVMKSMSETRRLYKSVEQKGRQATDLEKMKTAEALYDSKGRENAIEMRYFNQFKTLLTPDQLMQLKKVEDKFNRKLMKQHHGEKKSDKKKK